MTRFLLLLVLLGEAGASYAQRCGIYEREVSEFRPNGGRVDWSRAHHQVAYDRAPVVPPGTPTPPFDLYVASPTETNPDHDRCLTCGVSIEGLTRNKGNPAWHPSGEYIVFQAERDAKPDDDYDPKLANPGRGLNNVLWLTNAAGTAFWRLPLSSAEPAVIGVLHPHVSDDGRSLSWSEQYARGNPALPGRALGLWRLVTARLDTSTQPPTPVEITVHEPQLDGRPMAAGFYENHGFTPDGRGLLFTSNAAPGGLVARLNSHIFTMEIRADGKGPAAQLTDERYNEHASFFPSGQKILWMSDQDTSYVLQGTDLWVMDPDGLRKERLTYLNRIGCDEYVRERVTVADSSINATGTEILTFAQSERFGDYGRILRIRLTAPF